MNGSVPMGEPAAAPLTHGARSELSSIVVFVLALAVMVFSFLPWWTLANLGAPLTFTGIGQPLGPEYYAKVLGWVAGRPGATTAFAGFVVLVSAVLQRGRFGGRVTRITTVVAATTAVLVCLAFAVRPEYLSSEILFQLGAPTTVLGPLVFSADPTGIGACYGFVGTAVTALLLLAVTTTGLARYRLKDLLLAFGVGVIVAAAVVAGWIAAAAGG